MIPVVAIPWTKYFCSEKNRTNAGGNGDLKKELLRLMHPDKNTTKNRDELFESLGAATALINDKM